MEHKFHECTNADCFICEGGLSHCDVCGGGEGDLTTECCGRKITEEESDAIYKKGVLDFKNGKWINSKSKWAP